MENNIFSPDWFKKKYFLGFISESVNSMDLYFYSHEQRYVLKVRGEDGKVVSDIEKVKSFRLTEEQGEAFCMNLDYLIPCNMVIKSYKEFDEELQEKISCRFSFPDDLGKNHMEDMVLYDEECDMVVPLSSDALEEYEYAGIDNMSFGYLHGVDYKPLHTYPERMICQLQGKPKTDMYKLYKKFDGKKVIFLGASFHNEDSRKPYRFIRIFFKIDADYYFLESEDRYLQRDDAYKFKKVKDISKLCPAKCSDKTEFYLCGDEVKVSEYHVINSTSQQVGKLWEMGNPTKDLWMPEKPFNYVVSFLACEDKFVFSLAESQSCSARIITSKMERIEGSTYEIKKERFIEAVASVIGL